MPSMMVDLRKAERTEAAPGWSDGQGLGFDGARLLALAIGGCFRNGLRHTAHAAEPAAPR